MTDLHLTHWLDEMSPHENKMASVWQSGVCLFYLYHFVLRLTHSLISMTKYYIDGEMDDNGNSLNKPSTSEHDKYLVPWETEAQLQLLWRFNSSILDFIWGRAMIGSKGGKLPRLGGDINDPVVNCGWKIFFSRCVLVPPSRFRPASKVGDAMTEHPQVGWTFDLNEPRITVTNIDKRWFRVEARIIMRLRLRLRFEFTMG